MMLQSVGEATIDISRNADFFRGNRVNLYCERQGLWEETGFVWKHYGEIF